MEERIRLRYVGLVTFITSIIGMFTGLVFTIIVIRRLTVSDFGVWQWIGRILNYTTIPVGIVNFWVLRFVARDHTNSKTALIMNSILSLPVLLIYLLASPALAGTVQATTFPFLVAAALIPLNYLILTLWNIGGGVKPQDPAYCQMTYEIVKVISAFLLVFSLGFALVGAILSLELASIAQLFLFVILLRKYLHGSFKNNVAKQWVSYSWLSTYISQSGTLVSLDTVMVVLLTGVQALTVLAYYGVAGAVASMVSLTGGLAYGLTPRLIKGGKASDVETVLKLTMLFGIPMLVGILVITRTLVYLYTSVYLIVVPIVTVLAVSAFSDQISGIADSVLTATVDVDKGKPKFKDLARSRLFLLPTINITMGAAYLVVLYLLLTSYLTGFTTSPEQIGLVWAICLLSVKLPFILLKFWLSRRVLKFGIPYRQITKYLVAAGVMAAVLTFCLPFVTYAPSIYQFIVYPLTLIGTGAVVYLTTLFLIDKEFRQLVRILIRIGTKAKQAGE